MIKKKAKDAFWNVVEDCLVKFHQRSKHDARQKSINLRKRIESPPIGLSSELFYHNEPFNVASNITGSQLDLSQCRSEYDDILNRHNW